jgi:hypothetical protein
MLKRLSIKAAASDAAKRPRVRFGIEPLSDARTPLSGFLSIPLENASLVSVILEPAG